MIERFARNTAGRDVIVGDIHGHFTKLQAALDFARFDPTVDRLFCVGDLVDRGPESDKATEWLEKPWFHAVSGNHEAFAIEWIEGGLDQRHYIANGGAWNVVNPPSECHRLAAAFRCLPIAIELETEHGLIGIVHAGCPYSSWDRFREIMSAGGREAEHAALMAHWSRERISKMDDGEVAGVRAVVSGHTPVDLPTALGNTYFIDTGGWRGRSFTLLDAATLRAAMPPSPLEAA